MPGWGLRRNKANKFDPDQCLVGLDMLFGAMVNRIPSHAINSFLLSLCVLGLGACQTIPDAPSHSALDQPQPSAFIEAACGGCHGIEPPFLSPNPHAPSFAAIANQPGLGDDTLASWLRDAHNYPEMMDFDLEPEQVDAVADYMISLRRADYVPEQ